MVMRGVIYKSAGSSLFLWVPACLPKFVFPLILSIGALCVYEKEREHEHHLNVCGFVLSGFVSPCVPFIEDRKKCVA